MPILCNAHQQMVAYILVIPRFVALHTPGHTPEHLSFVLYDNKRDSAVPVAPLCSAKIQSKQRSDHLAPDRVPELRLTFS